MMVLKKEVIASLHISNYYVIHLVKTLLVRIFLELLSHIWKVLSVIKIKKSKKLICMVPQWEWNFYSLGIHQGINASVLKCNKTIQAQGLAVHLLHGSYRKLILI